MKVTSLLSFGEFVILPKGLHITCKGHETQIEPAFPNNHPSEARDFTDTSPLHLTCSRLRRRAGCVRRDGVHRPECAQAAGRLLPRRAAEVMHIGQGHLGVGWWDAV